MTEEENRDQCHHLVARLPVDALTEAEDAITEIIEFYSEDAAPTPDKKHQLAANAKAIVDDNILENMTSFVFAALECGVFDIDDVQNFNGTYPSEWYVITAMLAKWLMNRDEMVLNSFGCHFWGRDASGQGVHMDKVMQDIAEDISS